MSETDENPVVSESPHANSKFKQQNLCSCFAYYDPLAAGIILLVMFLVALILGIPTLLAANNIKTYEVRYDDKCPELDTKCTVTLKVDKDMKGPLYIYYKLTNFYQSNFLFGNSYNWKQLTGEYVNGKDIKLCATRRFSEGDKEKDDHSNILVPCGAYPSSVFNDSFTFPSSFPELTRKGISIKSRAKYFKPANSKYAEQHAAEWLKSGGYAELFPDAQTDERFINWMNASPFKTFWKLWAKTDKNVDVKAGDYDITIDNNYPVSSFKGKKYIVLSQTSWAGGKSLFLGYYLIALACISLILSILFFVFYFLEACPLYKDLKSSVPLHPKHH